MPAPLKPGVEFQVLDDRTVISVIDTGVGTRRLRVERPRNAIMNAGDEAMAKLSAEEVLILAGLLLSEDFSESDSVRIRRESETVRGKLPGDEKDCESCGQPATRICRAGIGHPVVGPKYVTMKLCDRCSITAESYGPMNEPVQ